MDAVELARAAAHLAEFADVVHVAIEDHDAVVVETIRDENPAVRQKRDILWLAEVRLVAALHALLAECFQ